MSAIIAILIVVWVVAAVLLVTSYSVVGNLAGGLMLVALVFGIAHKSDTKARHFMAACAERGAPKHECWARWRSGDGLPEAKR